MDAALEEDDDEVDADVDASAGEDDDDMDQDTDDVPESALRSVDEVVEDASDGRLDVRVILLVVHALEHEAAKRRRNVGLRTHCAIDGT